MIQPTLNTASKIAFARGTSARPTSPGTDAVYAASHRTRSTFIGKVTARITASVGPPMATEIGTRAVRKNRPRSAQNIIRRRSQRSA